jgi:hypothetical protein
MGKTVFDIISESLKGKKLRYTDTETGKTWTYEIHGLDPSFTQSLGIYAFDVDKKINITLSLENLRLLEEI